MFIEISLFIILGVLAGVFSGLVPGLHPNMIILAVPVLVSIGIEPGILLAFIVSMAVANSVAYFIPSVLFGIPDSGNELSILPGHEMVMQGLGYHAVKLTVIGGLGAVIFSIIIFPLIFYAVPFAYNFLLNYIHIILILIAVLMIISEKEKVLGLVVFILAGLIGIFSQKLPIDNNLILFPTFSGLFGLSMIFLQLGKKIQIPKQKIKDLFVSSKLTNRAIVSGSLGGVVAGILPSVGSSEIASFFSLDRNKQSFLISIGSITTSNIILSVLALWLIGRTRSGVSVAIENFMNIGVNEVFLIILFSVISVGLSSVIVLILARNILQNIALLDYSLISFFVLLFILLMIFTFTGFTGLLLSLLCSTLGIATNLAQVKRGLLMGVLMVPTIVFYLTM